MEKEPYFVLRTPQGDRRLYDYSRDEAVEAFERMSTRNWASTCDGSKIKLVRMEETVIREHTLVGGGPPAGWF